MTTMVSMSIMPVTTMMIMMMMMMLLLLLLLLIALVVVERKKAMPWYQTCGSRIPAGLRAKARPQDS